ncbi:MAG TPA: MBL fold metallo-hydrolase [Thermoplasmata archaeon]|nr:MBL fold metallo-hydrolase [Thermoplasmata archaeon]
MSPTRLSAWRHGEDPPLLLDVRPLGERSIARLEDDRSIPFDELPARARELPAGRPIVVYCHFGGTASRAADLLRAMGYPSVSVLEGGIDEYSRWVDPTVPRYADPPTAGVVIHQFAASETGCLAHLLWDPVGREAAIVDPGRDVEPYLSAVAEHGLTVRAIVETHTHADHLSGHARLHDRLSADIWLCHRSPASYPHRALTEGESIRLGSLELLALETPGHTRDHLSIRAGNAVLVGDTLLPGSCGRTDLGDGDPVLLWESLTTKLLALPDDTEVLPAHYGSRHGLPPPERFSTYLGFERRTNEALLQPDRASFLRYMTEGWPAKPHEFDRIVGENLRA